MIASVSVVIPTYNRAASIGNAIESVLNQTHRATELIVVDDGSQDDTELVVSRFGDRVQYWKIPNGGPARARNMGVQKAGGEWIAFLDSDDTWNKTKLERQLTFMDGLSCDICFHDMKVVRLESGYVIEAWNHKMASDHQWPEPIPSGLLTDVLAVLTQGADILFTSTLLIRRSVFEAVGGFNQALPMCEDIDIYLRLAVKYSFGFLNEPLAVRGWASNWAVDRAYQARIEAMRRSLEEGKRTGDFHWVRRMRRAIAVELRRLGGLHRSQGSRLKAIRAYASSLRVLAGGSPTPMQGRL